MNTPKENSIQKMTIREFITISQWAFVLLFQVSKPATLLYLLFNILDKLSPVFNAIVFAKALDQIVMLLSTPGENFQAITPYLVILIAFIILNTVFSYLRTVTGDYTTLKSKPVLTRFLYKKLNELGIQNLENPEINNKIIRVKDTVDSIRDYVDNVVQLISNLTNIGTSVVVVFTIVPWLVIPIIPIAIAYLVFDKRFRQELYEYTYGHTEETRRADAYAQDLTDSKKLEEITINNAFRLIDKKYSDFWTKYTDKLVQIVRTRVTGLYVNQISYDIVSAFGYIFVFARVIDKLMTIGNATLAIRSLQLMQDSITETVLVFNKTYEFSIKLRDTYALFTTETKIPDGKVQMNKLESGLSIEFRDMTFTYPGAEKPIYINFNLKVREGEKIAIVGHNGAGKTTLVKLLARFYKPDSGQILVNGENISNFSAETYYHNMGIMFQDYNTYPHMTVEDNILIGRPEEELNKERLVDSAKKAEAQEFIEKLRNGYDTTLSEKFENGTRLSTGQWQKIAIARFFYRNPSLVIFDEPTAAIDAVSEFNIFNNIYEFFKNKTVIIISHRFSTVRNADRIIVISQGQLVEEGTHAKLMKLKGVYANAFNLQAKGYEK